MEKQPFHIGLCMAGAVSAGAYTAGVMDFLIEALDTWEQKKQSGEKNIPSHTVKLSVMGGASAGGMTSIIAAAALSNPIQPIKLAGQPTKVPNQPQNKFFNAWVDLLSDDMFPTMLANGDIERTKKASSVLNSDFIDQIATNMVKADANKPVKRNYLADEMLMFTTISNLEGFHYDLAFRGNAALYNKYLTTAHDDLALFRYSLRKPDYKNDGFIPLSFIDSENTDIARTAAMATGAFPMGLSARTIKRPAQFVNDAKGFINKAERADFVPADKDYEACYVDGGLINNEPFDIARRMLHTFTGEQSEGFKSYKDFKSTVLMIDPFPSEPGKFTPNLDLLGVVSKTLGTMIGQLRFKPDSIEAAFDPNDASRYLISPSRNRYGLEVNGEKAISCGGMGGFGGFLHRSFRVHDYFLGRRNCQKFLKDVFTVPADAMNPIFEEGYQELSDPKPYLSKDSKLQIIPLFVTAEEQEPVWPVISFNEIERYNDLLKIRLEKVMFSTLELGWLDQVLGLIGSRILIRRKLASSVMNWIKKSLTEHELLK